MKAESTIKPNKFTVDKIGDDAHISIFDDIKKVTKAVDDIEQEVYEYDHLTVIVPYRDNLKDEVDLNFNDWLLLAREVKTDYKEPNELEVLKADVDYIAIMTGVQL